MHLLINNANHELQTIQLAINQSSTARNGKPNIEAELTLVDESGNGEFSFEQKSSNGDDDDDEDEDTATLRDFRGSCAVKRRGEKLEGHGGKRRR